ncbi:DEAD/DEAH box helicase [Alteribacillus iranensis]|uniref:ATP-dependent RNA helicase CshA n=1 Tax=Alteribacillus iranensis TaxID=930128 RepID=A0A1I2FDK5_9BACI|nr:DEAD/DEAH box helicase [Alteribacillus iranensis]SFF02616.1 ATP-dependent RNA helicase DeaD [Alteribacillus iranensis]
MALFTELQLDEQILKAVNEMGFEEATPIQSEVIPKVKEGNDIIGQAQTGTGKTAAFGIPLIEQMNTEEKHPQGLVLAPTRELAIQVAEEINRLGRFKGVKALAVYGGQEISRQIKALKRHPQIIVATPGRFMDHMRRRTIRPAYMNMVVLDEADEMLSMGFIEDIETILAEVPEERQTLLFSATMPKRLQSVTERFMENPESVKVKSKGLTVSNIEQRYIEVPEKQKFETLCHLLDITPPELAIVFGRTKRRVDELSEALSQRGYAAEGIHGDLKQEQRDKVLRKFKNKTIDILVATDVAARGLDVSGVTHVYNFDLPQDPESYVHRIGRTGRAGKEGIAFSFATPKEISHLKFIESTTKKKMIRQDIPTFREAMQGRYQQAVDKLLETVKNEDIEELEHTAKTLLSGYDPVTLVAAALKMNTKEPDQGTIKLTEEASLRPKKSRGDRNRGGDRRGRNRGFRGNRGNRKKRR